jgi:hypothetical protein
VSLSTAAVTAGAGVLCDTAGLLRDTKKRRLRAKEKITKTQLEKIAEMTDVTLSEICMINKELCKNE